ncbi:MAG: hypothetical protein NC408_04340 [Candidatus Gastranaerophilales bacterium]|nr:hypothetical protein [Candidatus Gastranaerophilales bacterium]
MYINKINNYYNKNRSQNPGFGERIPYSPEVSGAFDHAERLLKNLESREEELSPMLGKLIPGDQNVWRRYYYAYKSILDFCNGIKNTISSALDDEMIIEYKEIPLRHGDVYTTTVVRSSKNHIEHSSQRFEEEDYQRIKNENIFSTLAVMNKRWFIEQEFHTELKNLSKFNSRLEKELADVRQKVIAQSTEYKRIKEEEAVKIAKAKLQELNNDTVAAQTKLQKLNGDINSAKATLQNLNEKISVAKSKLYRLNENVRTEEAKLAKLKKTGKTNDDKNKVHYSFADRLRILCGRLPQK